MEQNQNIQAQQPPQKFVCNGDCKNCRSMQQWSFCASVHAYSNMKVLDKVMETLAAVQASVQALQATAQELSANVDAIQATEAVFDPNAAPAIPADGMPGGMTVEQFVV